MQRTPQAQVDALFVERWSPRAFSSEPLGAATIASLFEAARWAPSAMNEQPWLFLYAATEEDLRRYRPLLVEQNRVWADRAPLLAFLFARRRFANGAQGPNPWAAFDAGSAWMSLALQAHRLGLHAHAMGGFIEEKVYETLGVPAEDYQAMVAIAVGRAGSPSSLPDFLRERERPNVRKPLLEVARSGPIPADR